MEDRKYGLKELQPDDRDFALGAAFDLPKLEDLPQEFLLGVPKVEHQANSDFCAAFASCYLSELQENEDFEASWTFAKSKELSGDPAEWGQDLRTIMKTHQKFGALKKEDSPYSLKEKDETFLRHIEKWPELKDKAEPFKKKSYFKVVGRYDDFDNIRAAIYKFREEKQGVILGLLWGWPIDQVNLDAVPYSGFGHAVACLGWAVRNGEQKLVIINSYGTEAGESGLHYVSRGVINMFASKYGAFMMVDMPDNMGKDEIQWRSKYFSAPFWKRWLMAIFS